MTREELLVIHMMEEITKAREFRSTGFGLGVERWIGSWQLKEATGWSFDRLRKELRKGVRKGRIVKQSVPGQLNMYSLVNLKGCHRVNDYFIKSA